MSETTNLKLFKHDNPTTNTNNFDVEKTLNDNWDKLDENAGAVNEKLESLEKVDSTTNETITAIQEEQTTQNENIEKNAEGIAQNKKDVDEELTKIKKENSLLKSQIPTGTASGNSIHLGDSSNMDFEWKLRGKSYQETTQGKNLFDEIKYSDETLYSKGIGNIGAYFAYVKLPDSFKTKFYANVFLKGTIQNKLAIGFSNNNTTEITYRVYDKGVYFENKECDFTNAENVYFAIANSDRVTIDTDVKTIFDNFNIMVTKEEDNIYEPYTGGTPSPNPDYPQEIQNVGDNINLYDKNNPNILNTPIDSNGTGVNVQNTYKTIWIPCKPNTTYTVSKIFDTTRNRFAVGYSSIEPNYSQAVEGYMSNEKANVLTVTTNTTAKYLLAYVWITGGSTTYEEMLDSIKIEEGTKATFYSNYNCGSVGVTISNKNIFNGFFTTNGVWKDDGIINYAIQSKLYWRTDFIKIPNKNIYFSSKQLNIFSSAILLEFDVDKKYITSNKIYQVNSNLNNVSLNESTRFIAIQWNLQNATEIESSFTDFQIEVGPTASPYISHQEQEIIFPLAKGQKLRSLPNGVKDYLAEDGIHKNVGIIILNGSGGTNESYFKALDNKFALGVNTEKGLLLKNLKTDNLKISVLSDKFLGVPWDIMKDTIEGWQIALRQDGSYTYLRLLTTGIEDTKALETFLQNNNAIVEYPLAEEEIIPYTPEQQAVIDKIPYTYKNVTNISVDNELATLDITYKKDIETMFNNQAKEYNERLSNIENLLNTTDTSALLLDNLENDLKEEV